MILLCFCQYLRNRLELNYTQVFLLFYFFFSSTLTVIGCILLKHHHITGLLKRRSYYMWNTDHKESLTDQQQTFHNVFVFRGSWDIHSSKQPCEQSLCGCLQIIFLYSGRKSKLFFRGTRLRANFLKS